MCTQRNVTSQFIYAMKNDLKTTTKEKTIYMILFLLSTKNIFTIVRQNFLTVTTFIF